MRFESRMWETSYRGPLWIHAGGKVPDSDTIQSVEALYKKFYGESIELPNRYPLGSIVGQVDL